MAAVVTLLTDFGMRDEYAGVMKGVILSRCPGALIVDISHSIAPQDIQGAALMLEAAYGYFPEGSIHVVVVDPGVGTPRDIIFAQVGGHRFLAPDNGVLTAVLGHHPPRCVRRITRTDLFLPGAAFHTFHGRDRFSPVASFLAGGGEADRLGPESDCRDLVRIRLPAPVETADGLIMGEVTGIDRFGNLITNIPWRMVSTPAGDPCRYAVVSIGDGRREIRGISKTYGSVASGEWVAVVGSRGMIELAVNGASAADLSGAALGDPVCVRCRPSGGSAP
jgi:S-adenosylmethionine hydrolase